MTALITIRNALGFLRNPMLQQIDIRNEYAEKSFKHDKNHLNNLH
jgi:hypothetical protein